MYLHEEDIPTVTMISDDDKGLVSHVDIPFQISKYGDSIAVLERMDPPAKLLVDEKIPNDSVVSSEEKGGTKDHDCIGKFCLIGTVNGKLIATLSMEIPFITLILTA